VGQRLFALSTNPQAYARGELRPAQLGLARGKNLPDWRGRHGADLNGQVSDRRRAPHRAEHACRGSIPVIADPRPRALLPAATTTGRAVSVRALPSSGFCLQPLLIAARFTAHKVVHRRRDADAQRAAGRRYQASRRGSGEPCGAGRSLSRPTKQRDASGFPRHIARMIGDGERGGERKQATVSFPGGGSEAIAGSSLGELVLPLVADVAATVRSAVSSCRRPLRLDPSPDLAEEEHHDHPADLEGADPARIIMSGPFTAKCNGEIFGVEEKPHEEFDSRVSFWGESLSLSSTLWTSVSDTIDRSEPFGKYCLNRPLVCSLRPRSHE